MLNLSFVLIVFLFLFPSYLSSDVTWFHTVFLSCSVKCDLLDMSFIVVLLCIVCALGVWLYCALYKPNWSIDCAVSYFSVKEEDYITQTGKSPCAHDVLEGEHLQAGKKYPSKACSGEELESRKKC